MLEFIRFKNEEPVGIRNFFDLKIKYIDLPSVIFELTTHLTFEDQL